MAVELVSKIGGEIISADSMAVYTGMDIGTAKPTSRQRSRARFHLIDVADPALPFSVGDFQKQAEIAIDEVLKRNPPAVVVGGSGLYVRAAVDGLDLDIPGRSDELRADIEDQARQFGNEHVHNLLRELDPVSADRIHPNNLKRVIRAIEICKISGVAASEMFSGTRRQYEHARWYGLTMKRERLYERINNRVDSMMAEGLVDEVATLMQRGIDTRMTSMQGLGYKEIAGFLSGDYDKEKAVELLKRNTRRFAKRQYTWFRQDTRIKWLNIDDMTAEQVSETIMKE
ncbi:MAG: tRNA (adenosine(37)-N6)-dimethylallyltransferase MiaA [Armatimonadetes bacterium]|nr:tRNA (adenosine(37)-N6)-dimethylallyltransferase MiaA [Armatimonadota bacterium]